MVTLHVFRSNDRGRTWQDFAISRSPRLPKGCPHNPACPVKVPGIALAVDDRSRTHVLYSKQDDDRSHPPRGVRVHVGQALALFDYRYVEAFTDRPRAT